MSAAATPMLERGGSRGIRPEDKPGPGFRAIGIVYAKETSPDFYEIRVMYESHIGQPLQDAIAERFGTGAKEWNVTEKP